MSVLGVGGERETGQDVRTGNGNYNLKNKLIKEYYKFKLQIKQYFVFILRIIYILITLNFKNQEISKNIK